MNVQPMPNSAGISALPLFQSGLPVLRRSAYSDALHAAYFSFRMLRAPNSGFESVGRLGPFRGGDSQAGQGAALDWPGKGDGIRGPTEDETPLSFEEVKYATKATNTGDQT